MKQMMARFWLVALIALLVTGCSPSTNKIGSTKTGLRVSVMPAVETPEAVRDVTGDKPNLTGIITTRDWPQAGYDATHVMPNAQLSTVLEEIWSTNIGAGSSANYKILARPVAAEGRIFVMDAYGAVTAVDASSGDELWSFETKPQDQDGEAIGGGLGTANGLVYATTGFGDVLALRAADGGLVWRRALGNPLRAAPTLGQGRVYVVGITNQLHALDARTGEILWQHSGIAENATLMGASSPALGEQSVIISYSSGEIYDLRGENGRVLWNYTLTTPTQVGALPAIADIRGLPVLDRGRIVAISHSGRMAAIEEHTGERVWEVDVGGINTPVVNGDAIFVLSNDRQLMALSRVSGRTMWVRSLPKHEEIEDKESDLVYWTGPVLAGNNLWLVNSLGQAISFSPTDGAAVSVAEIGDATYVAPIVVQGTLYVVTDHGRLVALK